MTADISLYHAHLYFDAESLSLATDICGQVEQHSKVKVGRIHQKNVGPHPMWSCQFSFDQSCHDRFVSWLADNRAGLSVLIHPLSGDDYKDHTEYAAWLGEPQILDLSMFVKKA